MFSWLYSAFRRNAARLRLAALLFFAGALPPLALAPIAFGPAALIAPWPIFALGYLLRKSPLRLAAAALVIAALLSGLGFFWLVGAAGLFAGVSPGVGAAALLGLGWLLQPRYALFLLAVGLGEWAREAVARNQSALLSRALAGALQFRALWQATAAIVIELCVPALFPWRWGDLAQALPPCDQLAELCGVHGLGFLLLALSRIAYDAVRALQIERVFAGATLRPNRRAALRAFFAISVFSLWWASGRLLLIHAEQASADAPRLRTAVLQTNAPREAPGLDPALLAEAERIIRIELPRLAQSARQSGAIDLFVLPESALPYLSTDDAYLNRRAGIYSAEFQNAVRGLARESDAYVLLNEVSLRAGHGGNQRAQSLATLYDPAGERRASYAKGRLLPLGEFLPWEGTRLAGLTAPYLPAFLRQSRFTPGEERPSFRVDRAGVRFRVAPSICYEIIHPDYVREFFGDDAAPDLLINLTTDVWYGAWPEPAQHEALARLRSIEFRRSLVRANASGISAAFGPDGLLLAPGPTRYGASVAPVYEVPALTQGPTLYARYGETWLCGPLLALLALGTLRMLGRRS